MKFPPLLRPVAVLSLLVACDACSTPANRRELYNAPLADSGPWHDYSRRREAEAATGVSAGTAPSVLPGRDSRPTAPPPTVPVPAAPPVATGPVPPSAAPVAPDAPPGAAPAAPAVAPAPGLDPTITTTPATPVPSP